MSDDLNETIIWCLFVPNEKSYIFKNKQTCECCNGTYILHPKVITCHFHLPNEHDCESDFFAWWQERKAKNSAATCLCEVMHICILKESYKTGNMLEMFKEGMSEQKSTVLWIPHPSRSRACNANESLMDQGWKIYGATLASGVTCDLGPPESPQSPT